jgi:FkbM family methyltransferase
LISYAQNHEDVLLARALSGVESGFYIDVGAFDPTEGSVTRHFYELGWHGVNVEPQRAYAAKLRAARPRDTTIEAALSDRRGTATLYEVKNDAGMATIDAGHAERLRADSTLGTKHRVPVKTLAEVCEQHCAPGVEISFLKIDVEGHERAVLSGADWSRWRPRIVVVEATEPWTTRPTHDAWEPLLLDAGYAAAQFDGINRWYAGSDESALIAALHAPVNVLDDYAPFSWVSRVEALEAHAASLAAQLTAAELRHHDERQHLVDAHEELRRQAEAEQRRLNHAAAAAAARAERLVRALEGLQRRYEGLRRSVDEERALRTDEWEQITNLAAAVQRLSGQPRS